LFTDCWAAGEVLIVPSASTVTPLTVDTVWPAPKLGVLIGEMVEPALLLPELPPALLGLAIWALAARGSQSRPQRAGRSSRGRVRRGL
jgi:hypothetical protein